jgi:hypothetical protein
MASSRAFEDESGPLRPLPFLRERRIMLFSIGVSAGEL